jgi:hypothetical protein
MVECPSEIDDNTATNQEYAGSDTNQTSQEFFQYVGIKLCGKIGNSGNTQRKIMPPIGSSNMNQKQRAISQISSLIPVGAVL